MTSSPWPASRCHLLVMPTSAETQSAITFINKTTALRSSYSTLMQIMHISHSLKACIVERFALISSTRHPKLPSLVRRSCMFRKECFALQIYWNKTQHRPSSLSSFVYKHWSNHAPREIDSHTTANCLGPSAGNIDPKKNNKITFNRLTNYQTHRKNIENSTCRQWTKPNNPLIGAKHFLNMILLGTTTWKHFEVGRHRMPFVNQRCRYEVLIHKITWLIDRQSPCHSVSLYTQR